MRTKFRSGDVVYIKSGVCEGEYASIRIGNGVGARSLITCIRSNKLELICYANEIKRVSSGVIVEALTELKKICTTSTPISNEKTSYRKTAYAVFDKGEEVRVNAGPYEGCKVVITKVKHPSHHNTAYDCKLSNSHKISVWEHMIDSIVKEDHSDDLIDAISKAYKIPRNWLTGEGMKIEDDDIIVSLLQKKQLNLFERAIEKMFAKYAKLVYPEPKPEVPEWKRITATTIDDLLVIQGEIWKTIRNEEIYRKLDQIINELEMMV